MPTSKMIIAQYKKSIEGKDPDITQLNLILKGSLLGFFVEQGARTLIPSPTLTGFSR